MRISIVSLFPGYFSGPFGCGPTRVAREAALLQVNIVNPRDFTSDAHRTVDDCPFGGGAGMVLKPEPMVRAIESARSRDGRVVLLAARGRTFVQSTAREYSSLPHLVLVCGRYKGVDERVAASADEELSVGDFVLAGGEAAAIAVVEAVARLLPGAVEHEESVATDSFSPALLDAPWYTRPREFRGMEAPDVLVAGDHAAVAAWRREQALIATARRRPELLRHEVLTEQERTVLSRLIEKEILNGKDN
ncbi:tRNA (guanosine(37)-N1)-methyltransferase TrmD [candidate division WOR-3 bacterium]|nr:tRNA (guanosine(37)-N1)-methyltransferase TrmD [candidate division WOR-3 bacterium]